MEYKAIKWSWQHYSARVKELRERCHRSCFSTSFAEAFNLLRSPPSPASLVLCLWWRGKMQGGENHHNSVQLTAPQAPSCHVDSSLFRLPPRAVACSPIFSPPFPPITAKHLVNQPLSCNHPQKFSTASLFSSTHKQGCQCKANYRAVYKGHVCSPTAVINSDRYLKQGQAGSLLCFPQGL